MPGFWSSVGNWIGDRVAYVESGGAYDIANAEAGRAAETQSQDLYQKQIQDQVDSGQLSADAANTILTQSDSQYAQETQDSADPAGQIALAGAQGAADAATGAVSAVTGAASSAAKGLFSGIWASITAPYRAAVAAGKVGTKIVEYGVVAAVIWYIWHITHKKK